MAIVLSHSSALAWWRRFEGQPDRLALADVRHAPDRAQVDENALRALDLLGIERPFDVLISGDGPRARNGSLNGRVWRHALEGLVRKTWLPGVWVVCPELCLAQNAAGLDFGQRLLLLGEFFGTYRVLGDEARYDQPMLSSRAALADALGAVKGAPHVRSLREIARYAGEGAASPQESRGYLKLSLPNRHGGLGVSPILLNHEVPLDEVGAKLLGKGHCRVDLYFPKLGCGVEYDSYQEHLGKKQHDDDASRRTVLSSLGVPIHVLTNAQLRSPELMSALVKSLYCGSGRSLRIRCADFRRRQDELWEQLDGVRPKRLRAEGDASAEER
ncbi:MAG: hypothetical protein Q4D06_01215 [Coriobacteriia bacterium]|nr:hypothetical protein [Coriobacteriia bacterium]